MTAATAVRCVGYSKGRGDRCRVELEERDGQWVDAGTGVPGGPAEGGRPPRCTHHPERTDPDGWAVEWTTPEGERIMEGPPESTPEPKPEPEPEPDIRHAAVQKPSRVSDPRAQLLEGVVEYRRDQEDSEPAPAPAADDVEEVDALLRSLNLEPAAESSPEPVQEPEPDPVGPGAAAAAVRVAEGPFSPAEVEEYAHALLDDLCERRYGSPLSPSNGKTLARGYTKLLNHLLKDVDPNNPVGAAVISTVVVFGPKELARTRKKKRAPESGRAEAAGPEQDGQASDSEEAVFD